MELETDNFKIWELRCHCRRCNRQVPHRTHPEALAALQRVRDKFHAITGRGLSLTSAYRCALHPREAKKEKGPGKHNRGKNNMGTAFDIKLPWGRFRMLVLTLLLEEGFDAFGFANSFLHADWKRGYKTSWTY